MYICRRKISFKASGHRFVQTDSHFWAMWHLAWMTFGQGTHSAVWQLDSILWRNFQRKFTLSCYVSILWADYSYMTIINNQSKCLNYAEMVLYDRPWSLRDVQIKTIKTIQLSDQYVIIFVTPPWQMCLLLKQKHWLIQGSDIAAWYRW